jgi:Uma2 family endonuclease
MRIAPPKAVHWTRDEYYKMHGAGLFAGRRVELIRGEVIEMSPQESLHATAVVLLDDAIRSIFGEGFVVRVQLPLCLGSDSDPEPDLAVVSGRPRDYIRSHPSDAILVVEAADSSLEHDRTRKAEVYAAAGIQDYWIVNLVDRQIEVYRKPRRGSGPSARCGYAERTVLEVTTSVSPLALPEATLRVADLMP